MVNPISFVEEISKSIWRWGVNDSGRYDIWHVTEVTIFGNLKLGIRIELADCSEMYITTMKISECHDETSIKEYIPKDCDPYRLLSRQIL